MKNKENLKEASIIKQIISKYNLVWKEFKKETSWGKIDDKIVIIDYGFTYTVKKNYY